MHNLPTIRQLQYLLMLSKTMNFSRAAELCHVTQPTMSAGIREMESLLGLPVLDRSRRKIVVFTAFGRQVLESAQKITPHLTELIEKAHRMAEPLSGSIRLGLIPTIAPYILPDILPALQKSFKNIDFQITEDMSAGLVEKLHNGHIDIALMAFPYEAKSLNQLTFFEEPFYCAAQTAAFGKDKKKLYLSDLPAHKLLLLEDGHCLREHALSACNLQDSTNQNALSATSLLTLMQMVDQGYGITLLPEMVIKQGLIPPNIELIPFHDPLPTRKIGVCWRQKDPQESNITAIIDTLKETLKSS